MSKQISHEFYMQRCFELAQMAHKSTKSNPMVGAVLVYEDKIIGEGYHKEYGKNHAEINALDSVKADNKKYISQSKLYVSLEPCFHEGKTPPCVDAILRNNIKEIYISCLDPFEKVAGKGVGKLRDNGAKVTIGILEKEGKNLIRKFIANTIQRRPYVIVKFAQSKDGFIGKEDKEVEISNIYSRTLSHKWRSEVDGIMIGTQTAITDNPKLTNRLYNGDSPLRIVLDRQERIPKTHELLSDNLPTLIFASKSNYAVPSPKKIIILQEWNLTNIMAELYRLEIYSLIVEGGAQLIQSFLNTQSWDEYRVFTGSNNLNAGIKAPLLRASLSHTFKLKGDQITCGYPK